MNCKKSLSNQIIEFSNPSRLNKIKMPMRQIRKQSIRGRKSRSQHQRGGDPGRIALPPAYWGKGIDGYYPAGSPELNPCSSQVAVSQGVISKDGNWAGPNLYPMLGGSSNKRLQRSRSRSHSQKRSNKKSKSKSRQQKGGSCGCSGRRQYKPKTMKGGFSKKVNRRK